MEFRKNPCPMRPDHEQALKDLEDLLPKALQAAQRQDAVRAAEDAAAAKVLERVIELLLPQFDLLADIIIVRREEVSSEANRALNRFVREDYPEKGVLLVERDLEDGTGTPNQIHLSGCRLYLLRDGRLLLCLRDGVKEETRKRGMRPDRHEAWVATCQIMSPLEAIQQVAFIEEILDTVKDALVGVIELAEDSVQEGEKRTAQLLKLIDRIN
jgi:hypothetical protein